MGLSCANLHFRTTEHDALRAALRRRGITRSVVLPSLNGWTSLYEERASQQDVGWVRQLTADLSEDLDAAAVAFMVHDSDVACYWLFDAGEMLDQYNSWPDYFDGEGDGPPCPSGGRTDVLVRYGAEGTDEERLAAVLAEETVFAESVVEQIADALGIDRDRALSDYRDAAEGGPDDYDDSGDDDGGPGGGLGFGPGPAGLEGLTARVGDMLGFLTGQTDADPEVASLVQAAARGEEAEVGRLLDAGVDMDAEAPAPLPGTEGIAQALFPGGAPRVAMTPLVAAVVHKQRRIVELLLARGADPNRATGLGTPLHAAAGAGEAELLRVLVEHGGDAGACNSMGQTPLDVVRGSLQAQESLAQSQAMIRKLGVKIPGGAKLADLTLPVEGWEACARLLNERESR